jgi:hypothetical protein
LPLARGGPDDFASVMVHYRNFQPAFADLPGRHPLPAPLAIYDLDRFLSSQAPSTELTWR